MLNNVILVLVDRAQSSSRVPAAHQQASPPREHPATEKNTSEKGRDRIQIEGRQRGKARRTRMSQCEMVMSTQDTLPSCRPLAHDSEDISVVLEPLTLLWVVSNNGLAEVPVS